MMQFGLEFLVVALPFANPPNAKLLTLDFFVKCRASQIPFNVHEKATFQVSRTAALKRTDGFVHLLGKNPPLCFCSFLDSCTAKPSSLSKLPECQELKMVECSGNITTVQATMTQ